MNSYWEKRANNINQAAENRNTEEVFRQAKRTDKPPKPSKLTCPTHKLEQHFTDHFKLQPEPAADDLKDPEKLKILPKIDIHIEDSCPTMAEVQATVKKLKNGRCLGSDGVAGEYLKYADTPKITELTHKLFHRIWAPFCLHFTQFLLNSFKSLTQFACLGLCSTQFCDFSFSLTL